MIDEWNLRPVRKAAPARRPVPRRGDDVRAALAWPRLMLSYALSPQVVSLLAGAVAWETIGRLWRISFLPPLSAVLSAAAGLIASGEIVVYLLASLTSLAIGYALAASSGLLLGLLMGRYETLDQLLDPYIVAFQAAPKLVFIPPLYAIFGVSRWVQVAVIFLSSFFIIVMNTRGGMRAVDPDHVEMARLFGASERQVFWRVLLPGSLPLAMAGLRLGVGRAIKGMVKGEMFIALFGLGAMLRRYGSRFDAEHVFAIILVVVAVALACSLIVALFERRLVHWTDADA